MPECRELRHRVASAAWAAPRINFGLAFLVSSRLLRKFNRVAKG